MIHLILAGDVVFDRSERREAAAPESAWGDLLPRLRAADARIVNLDCAVHPQSPAIDSLLAAGIDACTLANARSLERGAKGLADTIGRLDLAGIRHAGAAKTLEEARRPVVWSIPSDPPSRLALISMTETPAPEAGAEAVTNSFPPDLDSEELSWIADAIAESRRAGAQIVVFSSHSAGETSERPSSLMRRFAQFAIEQGADVFHGHGSHLFQGVETYRDKPILYDTGDLLDDTVVDRSLRSAPGFLFQLGFDGSDFRRLELIPLRLSYPEVARACGHDAERILDRMDKLSADLGTNFHRHGENLVLERWPTSQVA